MRAVDTLTVLEVDVNEKLNATISPTRAVSHTELQRRREDYKKR